MQPSAFKSDGCTLFPDLWIHDCCVAHDLADYSGITDNVADEAFFVCIVNATGGGWVSYVCAGLIVSGMIIGRPLWRAWKTWKDDKK